VDLVSVHNRANYRIEALADRELGRVEIAVDAFVDLVDPDIEEH